MNLTKLKEIQSGADGLWKAGADGIRSIVTTGDTKADFAVYDDKCLCYIKSGMGYPAIYPVSQPEFEPRAEAVLMDLDGTSVHSEEFWIWIIQTAISKLIKNPRFELEEADLPYVSGHSVSEHLQYCIKKYCPGENVEDARRIYHAVTEYEMNEILEGRGREGAFTPAPDLDEFLYKLKENNIKIGLVTSGLYKKAMPEIISAFRTLKMGDPVDFYDCIITAGYPLGKGGVGTLGELAPKPHPWLYAETARVGLGIPPGRKHKVIGIEDSSAGILSILLAGFVSIGISGGNIDASGADALTDCRADKLMDCLPIILGD